MPKVAQGRSCRAPGLAHDHYPAEALLSGTGKARCCCQPVRTPLRRLIILNLPATRSAQQMNWLHLVSYFFGGLFLGNVVPHLVSGMMGKPFQTPFAKPPGKGLSSSTVNVLWGFANFVAAYFLIARVGDFDYHAADNVGAAGAGILLIGLQSARHFGEFHGGNLPGRS